LEKYITVILAVSGALIFLSGYSYLSGYFGYFGVSLSELNFGTEEVLSHSFIVGKTVIERNFLFLLLPIFTLVLVSTAKGRNTIASSSIIWVATFTIILFATIVLGSANTIGQKRAQTNYIKTPLTRLDGDLRKKVLETFENEDIEDIYWTLLHANGSKIFLIGKFIGALNEGTQYAWIIRYDMTSKTMLTSSLITSDH
jgi:hypothetical protein